MKCIAKALTETEFRPRAKWWGFTKENNRYLMRYHHCLAVFSIQPKKLLAMQHETITDKRGVEFAIKHYLKEDSEKPNQLPLSHKS